MGGTWGTARAAPDPDAVAEMDQEASAPGTSAPDVSAPGISAPDAARKAAQRALARETVGARAPIMVAATFLLWLTYSSLAIASAGTCPGGIDADGGFSDANGEPSATAPLCLQLTLQPSPLVPFLLCVALVATLMITGRTARDRPHALRLLAVGLAFMAALVAIITALSMAAFANYPIQDWRPGDTIELPWFVSFSTAITPMVVR